MNDWRLLLRETGSGDRHVVEHTRSYSKTPPADNEPWAYCDLWHVRCGDANEGGTASPDPYNPGVMLTVAEIDALYALAHDGDCAICAIDIPQGHYLCESCTREAMSTWGIREA